MSVLFLANTFMTKWLQNTICADNTVRWSNINKYLENAKEEILLVLFCFVLQNVFSENIFTFPTNLLRPFIFQCYVYIYSWKQYISFYIKELDFKHADTNKTHGELCSVARRGAPGSLVRSTRRIHAERGAEARTLCEPALPASALCGTTLFLNANTQNSPKLWLSTEYLYCHKSEKTENRF